MPRHFFWVTLGMALGASAFGYQSQVAAQDSSGTQAEASASTNESGTSAEAGTTAGQDQSGTTSSGQAGSSQTANNGDSNQAGNQPASGTAADSHASSAETGSNASDANRAQNSNTNQSSQNTATTRNPKDPNAIAPPQQPRTDNQQSVQQDNINASRTQTDVSVDGRARLDASTQQRNQTTLQSGLQFGQATNRGLAIRDVDQSSIYFRSGFRRGDVIISLFGRPVRSQADFMRFVVMQPGRPVPVVVFRNGRQQTIYVEYPQEVVQTQHIYDNRAPQGGGAYLGVMFDVQARDAAVVLSVNPGSPAQNAGIQPRDVILAMNGQEIRSYPEVISVIRRMQPGQEVDIIVGRGQSESQLSAVLAASTNVRTATRQADVNVYHEQVPADVQIDVNGRNNNGRIIDRNNNGNPDRPLLPRLRN